MDRDIGVPMDVLATTTSTHLPPISNTVNHAKYLQKSNMVNYHDQQ